MRKVKPRAGWLDRYSYEESIIILSELALVHIGKAAEIAASQPEDLARDLLREVGFITDRINDRNWTPLLDHELVYDERVPPDFYVHLRQALGFFKKFEPLRTGVDKEAVAFEKFVASENRCLITNWRFKDLLQRGHQDMRLAGVVALAGEKCRNILGPVPELEHLHFRFGPGSTHNVKKSQANPRVKLGAKYECSNELADDPEYLGSFLAEFPRLAEVHGLFPEISVVNGKLEFVPKNAKTFRTIIVEPGLNVLYQQGIGQEIRRLFKKKTRINLNDDTRQHRLAWAASLRNSTMRLATVDFSAASDHISTELVAYLLGHYLPNDPGWFELLARGRTGSVTYKAPNGEEHTFELEKFSSMGNSYTWELESLIFYSLAWAICKTAGVPTENIGVFGDDLIIPSDVKDLAIDVFSFCGLPLNSDKSFWDGPFRETCGKDFFLGFDIRPYHQQDGITAETLFSLHNFYMRNCEPDMARLVRLYIHPNLKLFGPDGYGDGHLIGAWVPYRRQAERVRGWEGSRFMTYRHITKRLREEILPGDIVYPSYAVYVRGGPTLHGTTSTPSLGDREATFEKERFTKDGHYMCLFRNPTHLVVPGETGYERVSIYTLRRGIFI